MAKRQKMLPARKQHDRSRDAESLLMRSAESLGRMIGSLQRQLDGATKRLSETADDVGDLLPDLPRMGGADDSRRGGAKKRATRKRAAGKSASGTRKATGARSARKSSAGSRKGTKARTRAASRGSKKR